MGHLGNSRQELKGAFRTLGQVSVDTLENGLEAAKIQLKKGLLDMKRSQLALEESCLLSLKVKQEQEQDIGVGGSFSGGRNWGVRVNTANEVQEAESSNNSDGEIPLREQQEFDAMIETELEVFLARLQDIREARRQTWTMETTATATATTSTAYTITGVRPVVPEIAVPVVARDAEDELNDLRMLRDALACGDELEHELDVAQRELIDARHELLHVTERLEEAERQANALQAVWRGEVDEMRDQVRTVAFEVIDAQGDLNWAKDQLEDLEYVLDEGEVSGAELQEVQWTLRWARDEMENALGTLGEAQQLLEEI